MKQEFTRLLTDRGVSESMECDRGVASVDGGAFEVALDSRAQVVGAKVAKAVFGGLRQ